MRARSESRCRRPCAAWRRRCASSVRRDGRAGRCRSGSAGRAGRDARVHLDAVRVVAVLGSGSGRKSAAQPALSGRQSAPPSVDSNTPPLETPTYRCRASRGSMRIECEQLADRRTRPCDPRRVHRVVVEARDRLPGLAAVVAAEQTGRRSAGVPGASLARVTRREPEHSVNRAQCLALASLAERRRLPGFRPRPAAVRRAEHRGPQVPGLRGHQHDLRLAWILHDVMNDVTRGTAVRQASTRDAVHHRERTNNPLRVPIQIVFFMRRKFARSAVGVNRLNELTCAVRMLGR